MSFLEKYKSDYNALSNGGKVLHNSLYALSFALSLYPTWVYDSYYRNYIKSRVVQRLTLPDDISSEGILGLATASAHTIIPNMSSSGFTTSLPLDKICDDVLCQFWIVMCTSSRENLHACAQILAHSMSE